MNDDRTRRETDSPSRLRDQRRTAALVAQYINDLSGRRNGRRRRARPQPAATVRPSEGG